ncbi:MAG: class I SAM-dependent methyltransferase [Candidatus Babeliales bacterium]|jgi:hypothetical protein
MTRPMIRFIDERFKKACKISARLGEPVIGLIGAEIGVWQGKNAEDIIKTLSLEKLYLIDPYLPYVDGDKRNPKLTDPSPFKEEAKNRLMKYANQVILDWRFHKSIEASKDILPHLDFAYLDGDHTYENVSKELEAFYPLIKSGGVMGGHDINFYGVMKAVGEFAEKYRLHPMTDEQDWWIVKP